MKKKYSNTTYCASFKAQALAHVANGASIYGTAKEFNVAFSTIKQWCRQAQMPICSRELTEKQQEICKDYMESDLTKKEISMKYQVSEGTFRHWLNKYRVIMDSNIISTTNADRVENYATVRPKIGRASCRERV